MPKRERSAIEREFTLIADDGEKTQFLRKLSEAIALHRVEIVAHYLLPIFLVLLNCQVMRALPPWEDVGLGREAGCVVVFFCFLLFAYFAALRRLRRQLARDIRLRFPRAASKVCARCGYDLRGRTDPRCPGCGGQTGPASPDTGEDSAPPE
jgi:hypothetical protein